MSPRNQSQAMCGTRPALLRSLAAAVIPKWGQAAESWPAKPIKMVHAFAAGSVTANTGAINPNLHRKSRIPRFGLRSCHLGRDRLYREVAKTLGNPQTRDQRRTLSTLRKFQQS